MAESLMARLRARLEEIQAEMQPEAGFDRRAYGYGEDGADATFEEADLEEESPWRRPGSAPPPAEREPEPARSRPRPPASSRTGGPAGRGLTRPSPPPGNESPRQPPVRSPDPVSARGAETVGKPERGSARRQSSRLRRFRQRIRHPDSLRELFLLREVIDRPVALRTRPRGRRPT